MSNVP
ncbi:hypothetical protein LINPERHAP2_LOCUS32724 [Linum perenne]